MGQLNKEVVAQISEAAKAAVAEAMSGVSDDLEKRLAARFQPMAPAAETLARDVAALVRPVLDPPKQRRSIGHDPFDGKGLDFVRFVKAHAVGKARGADPAGIAKAWGYTRVAEIMGKSLEGLSPEQRAVAMTESVMADGGAIAPDEFSSEFIEILRAAGVVRASGARSIPMNGATLTFGRQNSSGTASYQGEAQNITPSKLGLGQLQASVKKLTALTPISNDLIRDARVDAEMLVRDDLVATMSLKEDITFIRGAGTQHAPKGILNWTSSDNKFDATQAGAAATVAEVTADLAKVQRLVDESDVNVDMATRVGTTGWLMTPRSKWFLFGLTDGNGIPVFRAELLQGKLWNHPVRTTTQIPNNLGGGTNESEVYFGVFSEAMITENTNLIVDAFPGGAYHDGSAVVSGISQDQTVIRTIARHDFLLRHNNVFAVIQAVKWGAS